jgi:hypothetical protein
MNSRRILTSRALVLTALSFTTVFFSAQAATTASPNFAGSWKENQAKRKLGSAAPLRFRQTGAQLEELRGPVEKPLVQPVNFGTSPYAIDNSKNTIEWKKIDASHFERKIYEKGKLLTTRRIEISADGRTMTEVTERSPSDIDTLTLKRTSGDQGLVGTWNPAALKSSRADEVKITMDANGLKTTNDRGIVQTLNYDGKPALVAGPATISGTMVAAKVKDANTIEITLSRDGVNTGGGTLALSADGKTLTITTKANAAKEPSVTVFEKQ